MPIIEINGLTKKYGGFTAVNDLTLSIEKGEVFGLLGPNGAGKTTTTLMLLGLTEPTSGSAVINGVNCTRDPINVKRITGYLADNVGFYPDMTGRENLRLTGRMNGMKDSDIEARISELLRRVDMTDAADKKTSTYSKGMRQRLGIADILMKDPDVLIMDEPTNGIDPEGTRKLMTLIRELADQDGKTILISSHQLHQIQQICDRVGIFVHGNLIACGNIEELGATLVRENGYKLEVTANPGGERLKQILSEIEGVRKIELKDNTATIESAENVCEAVVRKLIEKSFELIQLRPRSGDLDEIYTRYFEKAGDMNDYGSGTQKKRRKAVA